jgi:Ni/Co efflux regulator RcnB
MRVTLPEPERRPETTAITDKETGAMLRAFFTLSERWTLGDHDARILLGQPAPRTYARWKSGTADLSRVPHDTRQRLSMLMGIHKGLRYMFREPERGYAWMRKANRAFAGQSALERMLSGEIVDLAAVRSYLDAEVGGW